MSEITIESAGRRLAARRIEPGLAGGAPAPAILFLHGLNSSQAGYAPRARAAASALGAVCLTLDLGGHGRSEGAGEQLCARDHLGDCRAAYDALAAGAGVDPGRIGVCGASYGGYLAALLAGERRVRRLLLRAPALYPDDWLDVPLGRRGRLDGPPPACAALERIARCDGEVLVLESGRDEVIPRPFVEAYVRAGAHVRHEVIAEATHGLVDPAWEAEFARHILTWFAPL